MSDWLQQRLARIEGFDFDKTREEYKAECEAEGDSTALYPKLCGAQSYYLSEALRLAKDAMEELEQVRRRKDALEWAAESVLNDTEVSTFDRSEVYELLYAAADVVENGIKAGMTPDQLREATKDGIRDDEIERGRFIAASERCGDCEEVHDLDDDGLCEDCAEIRADSRPA